MIEILAVFKAKPGKEEQLRKATLDVVEPTRREAGCIRFDVSEDLENPGAFFIRESWDSEAALSAHFKQPYLERLVELHKSLLEGELKLHKLRVY